MFPRYGDTRGMDHMRLHPARPQPARQPEAVPTSFEGQCNPRDLAAGLDRLVTPAVQQAKQPFGTRLQLLAWLALNAGKHTGNQPTRLAHLDDGNDRAILVQGDEGPAQVVRLGHQGTPSVGYSDDGAISSPPAPYHLSAGGRWIRTVGPPYGGNDKRAECHIFKRRTGAEAQVRWNKAADRSRPTRDQQYRILPPPTSLFGDRSPRWGP